MRCLDHSFGTRDLTLCAGEAGSRTTESGSVASPADTTSETDMVAAAVGS